MEKEEHFQGYFTSIPNEVLYNKDLNGTCIRLYGMIVNLSNQRGYCWATNEYFSKHLMISARNVQKYVKQLEELSYIISIIEITNNGSRRVIKLPSMNFGGVAVRHAPTSQHDASGTSHYDAHNNNNINNDKSNQLEVFENLWNEYGKHGNKQPALKKFMKLSQKDIKLIEENLKYYLQYKKQSNEKLLYFSTYLNQEIYKEDYRSKIMQNKTSLKVGSGISIAQFKH